MPYIVKFTGTKSEEFDWFIAIDPETLNNLRAWEYAQQGLIDISTLSVTNTTITVLMEFDTEESYDQYLIKRLDNPYWKIRDNYYKSIGLVSTVEVL